MAIWLTLAVLFQNSPTAAECAAHKLRGVEARRRIADVLSGLRRASRRRLAALESEAATSEQQFRECISGIEHRYEDPEAWLNDYFKRQGQAPLEPEADDDAERRQAQDRMVHELNEFERSLARLRRTGRFVCRERGLEHLSAWIACLEREWQRVQNAPRR